MTTETKAQHTPGPWYTRFCRRAGGKSTWEIRHDAGHQWHVADVYGISDGEKTYGHGFAEANARLIAAAPETAAERDRLREVNAELVAALESALKSLEIDGPDSAAAVLRTDARAAIAKAKGVQS